MELNSLFNDKDFVSLTFNVSKYKEDVNLLSKFPSLNSLESFRKFKHPELELNNVIRYIVYCYDRESPILKKFMTEDEKRKQTSAIYAKFTTDSEGLFGDVVDDMMKCRIPEVNTMIIDFIRLYNDPEWALLLTGMESYYQKLNKLLTDDTSSKRDAFQIEETKGKLWDQCDKMSKTLNASAVKILTDHNPYLRRDLYCIIDQDAKNRLNITPERLAGIG